MSKFTDALKSTGNALLTGTSMVLDATQLVKMRELEEQMDALQEEYALLNASLSPARQKPIPYVK